MDEGTSLSSGSVNSEGNTHCSLHEESVKNGTVVTIVIKTVDKTFITDSLGGISSPDNTLVKIGDTEAVVLLVKLPKESIKTLSSVVDRSGVGRVENVGLATSWQGNINVSLGDFSARCSVSVNTHGSKMDNVSIDVGIHDSTAKVVGSTNIVVNSVTLGLGVLHGIGGGTLFSKVNNSVGLFVLNEVYKQIVFLGNIDVNKFDIFSRNFLPCITTNLRGLNRCKGITTKFGINVSSGQVVHNNNIMTLVGKVKGSGPSTESVTSKNNDLFLFSSSVCTNTVNFSVFNGLHGGRRRNTHPSKGHRGSEGRSRGDQSSIEENLHCCSIQ
mmetsp:Transcript_27986/g.39420  ORF Transcript_27986/g.39420 Transcript_27986/m.39420 type:complete len:328 (+) Transcript_27986:705-1688(+)